MITTVYSQQGLSATITAQKLLQSEENAPLIMHQSLHKKVQKEKVSKITFSPEFLYNGIHLKLLYINICT